MRHDDPAHTGTHRVYRTDPRCRVLVRPMPLQGKGVEHSHNLIELVIVHAGTGVHSLASRDWPIAAGEVFLVPPDVSHTYRESRGLGIINLLFEPLERWLPVESLRCDPGWKAMFDDQPHNRPGGRMRLEPDELREVVARCRRLEAELAMHRSGWPSVAGGEMLALAALLVRWWPLRADGVADPRLAEILTIMEAEHASPLSIAHLARRTRMSPRTLQRLVRDQLGCTPHQHLEGIRLEHAARLLSDPRHQVGAVARRVGFRDPSYFARRWRSRFGSEPSSRR